LLPEILSPIYTVIAKSQLPNKAFQSARVELIKGQRWFPTKQMCGFQASNKTLFEINHVSFGTPYPIELEQSNYVENYAKEVDGYEKNRIGY